MRNLLRHLILALTLPLIAGCETLFFRAVNGGGDARPITQLYSPEYGLKLDVYAPRTSAGKRPVALFFYGGSWQTGDRAQYAFAGRALASAGIVALVVDYRLFPQTAFPGFEQDAARAFKWAREHATQFGGDPERIFLVGHSAGAQIIALLATDGRYLAAEGLDRRDIAGVVGISGPYDFLPITDPKLKPVFGPEAEWPLSQPVNFVDSGAPPFLLLQGLSDHVVSPRNSTTLQGKLQAAGVPARFVGYPGVGHSRILAGLRFAWLAPTLRDTVYFIETQTLR